MKLALTLPGFTEPVQNGKANTDLFRDPLTNEVTAGAIINRFAEVAIYVGAVLMFFWAVWGVFDYLKAEGNKEALAKARKKIIWAVSGFIILLMAFLISDFLKTTLNPGVPNLTKIELRP